ncbi:MAG TPA: MEDS domain-containing protein [Rhizomicrobium sp.]|nr:MEDS domain-containing protein [Rhizomicrobium sp.]
MKSLPRHQCLIYRGAPTEQLAGLALMIRRKLEANYRCLYLNGPEMVAGMRGYLTSSGLDVHDAVISGRLILSSSHDHLVDGEFDPRRMLRLLKDSYDSTLKDGYAGLWASGDMAWEFGPAMDFDKLVQYERALEVFFNLHPKMQGVCQYHADVLPSAVVKSGLSVHPGVYVNETLSRINAQYVPVPA